MDVPVFATNLYERFGYDRPPATSCASASWRPATSVASIPPEGFSWSGGATK
jgi:hypothetical protein